MRRARTRGAPRQSALTAWTTMQRRLKPSNFTRLMPSSATLTHQRKVRRRPTWKAVLTATQPAVTGK